VLDRGGLRLVPVARTTLSVHYETGAPELPVLCLVTHGAVRLPGAVVTARLPGNGRLVLAGDGVLEEAASSWRVTRWWNPPRPEGLASRVTVTEQVRPPAGCPVPPTSYDGLEPAALVGAGPGLTPAGYDLLAGALVTARATGDPRLASWRERTRAALAERATTAVSRGLLHHALDGYATPELAEFLTALCTGAATAGPRGRLLAVGHSSGHALLAGVLYTLTTRELPARRTQSVA